MATDDRKRDDEKDEDAGLSPAEREFKRTHRNTWDVMQADKERRRREQEEARR